MVEETPVSGVLQLVLAHHGGVGAVAGQKPDRDTAQLFLAQLAGRAAFLAAVEAKGWCMVDGRRDVLAALIDRVFRADSPFLFHQIVTLVLEQGLTQRSPTARKLFESRIGEFPFLGPCVLGPENAIMNNWQGNPMFAPEAYVTGLVDLLSRSGASTVLGELVAAGFEPLADELLRLKEAARAVEALDAPAALDICTPSEALPPESGTREYKATFEWDSRSGQRNPGLAHASLRTVCAFLNSEGGTLVVGVGDDLSVIGLEGDFASIKDEKKEDTFEGRLRELMKNHIDPLPLNAVTVSFPTLLGRVVCQIDVQARPETVTYFASKDSKSGQPVEEVFVRDGNRTLALRGRKRDQFVVSRGR